MKKTLILFVLYTSLASLIFPPIITAQDMSNDDFILDLDPSKSITSPSISPSQSNSLALPKNGSPNRPFLKFSLNTTHVNFGSIEPGEPITRNLKLEVKGSSSFSINAYQNKSLTSETGDTIPDTTCDQGTCTELLASAWTSPLTYGFGYRCQAEKKVACIGIFNKENSYAQFPNHELEEQPESILGADKSLEAVILFKVNIPLTLSQQKYQNSVYLFVLPNLVIEKI